MKEALDQFRGVFATLQSSHATLEQELKRAQAEARERGRALLRPLLLELLDLRDRLAAGLRQPTAAPSRWLDRWRRRPAEPDSWREGLGITLRRLERILAERLVVRIELIGQRFDPHLGRVIGTTHETERRSGHRGGRGARRLPVGRRVAAPAEVIVTKAGADEKEAE